MSIFNSVKKGIKNSANKLDPLLLMLPENIFDEYLEAEIEFKKREWKQKQIEFYIMVSLRYSAQDFLYDDFRVILSLASKATPMNASIRILKRAKREILRP